MNQRNNYKLPFELNTPAMLAIQLKFPLAELEKLAVQIQTTPDEIIRPFKKKIKGKERDLIDTVAAFKKLSRRINILLQKIALPIEFNGGVLRKDTKMNALVHINSKYVYKLDIKSFFPSLKPKSIRMLFLQLGCAPQVATLLTKLTTINRQLPQGFPSSMTLANLYLAVFCYNKIAQITKGKYILSFWVDDVTVSSKNPISYSDIQKIVKAFESAKLRISRNKTEYLKPNNYKEITGVSANGKLGVSKSFLEKLEVELFLLRTNPLMVFMKDRYPDKYKEFKANEARCLSWIKNSIRGRLNSVKNLNLIKYAKINKKYADVINTYTK